MAFSLTDEALLTIETPALVVDGVAMRANISKMAERARAAGVALRPHAKTHKSPHIARLQREAGAAGIACATPAEAEALAGGGVKGLLITSPFLGATKCARVAALHRAKPLALVVDHPRQVDALAAALRPGDPVLRILVDCDVGQARTGVAGPREAVALAGTIEATPGLAYAGIQGFAGHAQHIVDPAERDIAATRAAAALSAVAAALSETGLTPEIVTGSGTGTYAADAAGPYNELQVGSYVFMDAEYARVVDRGGEGPDFAPSLFVMATVISANRPGQVTVDVGTKALALNPVPPLHLLGAPAGSAYRFAGDEHGVIVLPEGATPPPLGAHILVGATHCDPTVSLHSRLHVVEAGGMEVWPVLGRHAG